MNFTLIGLYLWGVLVIIYTLGVWKVYHWLDGVGLKALRILFTALLVHSIMSFLIRLWLIHEREIDSIASFALIGQAVLVYAGASALRLLYKHFN